MGSEAAYFPDALDRAREVRDGDASSPDSLSGSLRDTLEASAAGRLSGISDEQLMEQVRNGAKEALGALFRRYARAVRNIACRILRDEAEADDLVQEVFLFIFRKAALFDPARGSVGSWLVQVAWHRSIDRRRYLAARNFYTSLELEDDLLESGNSRRRPVFYEESMEGSLGRDTLRRIDESLTEDQRRVIHLCFFEGHTVGEIAALLGQTPGNVRNHYYRALEKMRREIFPAKLRKK